MTNIFGIIYINDKKRDKQLYKMCIELCRKMIYNKVKEFFGR